MLNRERLNQKRILRNITKSDYPIDEESCDYFIQYLSEADFTQNEIINMIYNLFNDYYYEDDDNELIIADLLLKQLKNEYKNHLKLSVLYIVALDACCQNILNLLLKYNIAITSEVMTFVNNYIVDLKSRKYIFSTTNQNETLKMYDEIYIFHRIQKIVHLKSSMK